MALTDEREVALWILRVMFNNDKDELNLETHLLNTEKGLQIFFFFLHKYSNHENFLLKGFFVFL